jgi:hypothetical protein
MNQKDMPLETFKGILERFKEGTPIHLQGEGETLLWSHLDDVLIEYGKRYQFSTISNGSIFSSHAALLFSSMGFSLDSLLPHVHEGNGRYNLGKVVDNILKYSSFKKNISIYSVDTGSRNDLNSVAKFCIDHGFNHVVQPLQRKEDYVQWYPSKASVKEHLPKDKRYCSFGFNGEALFYNVDGVALPCCFTKELRAYESVGRVKTLLDEGKVPPTCNGCSYLK